jgi:tRNA(Arg) A34 adenosine deaminase TadA
MAADQTTGVVIDTANQRDPLTATPEQLMQMLNVIQKDILPKTEKEVANGNKVFGAGILDSDFKCIFADTNAETTCPIFHGEVKTIYEWSQQTPAKERGSIAQSSIFLSTHEPCCMCVSSILWAGFNTIYYFFPYSVTSAQGIPHDIATMHELWGVNSYRKQNKYISTGCIMDMIDALAEGHTKKELVDLQNKLLDDYDKLANKYHSEKATNENNSLVLG